MYQAAKTAGQILVALMLKQTLTASPAVLVTNGECLMF